MNKFTAFNLKPELISALSDSGFISASPIQEKTIPLLLKKNNVLALAPTGTGKTLAYLIPIINNLIDNQKLQAIIISPTAALMDQIEKVAKDILSKLDYRSDALKVLHSKKDFTRSNPLLILTTLPLVKDIYSKYPVDQLSYIVIDEGDMITFDGFDEYLPVLKGAIAKGLVSFFSASLNIQDIKKVKSYFKIKSVIDVRSSLITSENVKHHYVNLRSIDKVEGLKKLLENINSFKTIVFTSSKNDLYKYASEFKAAGIKFVLLSGDLEKREIKQAIEAFKKPTSRLLLATDYASRGLDIPDVDAIISLDLPKDSDYYFHRAGRAGRFDKGGDSYIFYSEDNEKSVTDLKALIRRGVKGDLIIVSKNGVKFSKGPYVFKNLGKKDQSNDKLQKQIRHAIMETKSNKVKPGYKKKVLKAVEKVKRKHRMKVVRTNIARAGGNANDYHED